MRYFEASKPYTIRYAECEDCQKSPNIVTRHNHEMLEINTVISGTLCVKADKNEYRISAGETVIINPFALHSAYWHDCREGKFASILLNLRPFLSQRFSQGFNNECNLLLSGNRSFTPVTDDPRLADCIIRIADSSTQQDTKSNCLCYSLIFELLSILFDRHYCKKEKGTLENTNNSFLRETSKYIYENYTNKNISTSDIAAHLFMSTSVFCHTFKRHFGTNFTDYLMEYRINYAIELYQNNQTSLTEIAYNAGFSSYNYFSKAFKKYTGLSPATYFGRRKAK